MYLGFLVINSYQTPIVSYGFYFSLSPDTLASAAVLLYIFSYIHFQHFVLNFSSLINLKLYYFLIICTLSTLRLLIKKCVFNPSDHSLYLCWLELLLTPRPCTLKSVCKSISQLTGREMLPAFSVAFACCGSHASFGTHLILQRADSAY